ncbi:LysR family transcriptional regulator [Rhizobium sp. 16-449-1b]|uniref:LysR family transcriptional regulator n=1 Tax=Rhizobium sp. 16-449-1b TaxID=2819989 RepID=UPI001AD989F1|nr:LysR family transcriptional regulator [Rhizobium sp. 16-449-1b]MBO9195974.1 LysR family transcriptional regulator [Rhizobium sp. 16-449-1b]
MDRFVGLSVFVAAVDKGSLAAAARAHGITPAMAGKHLAAIEAQLGVRLLQRTTRKLHLTDIGRDYYQRSSLILDALDEADRNAAQRQDQPHGTLRVSAPTTFGALHLGEPVAEYTRRYPNVSVEMSLEDRYVDLIEGGFDMAIRIGTLPDSSLISRKFGESGMAACAAPSYLDKHGRPKEPADLRRHDRLAFSKATSEGDWSFTDRKGKTETVSGPTRLKADNMQMLLAAALNGGGVVYGPTFVLGEHISSGALEQVLPDYTTESLGVHALYPSSRMLGTKVRCFVDILEEKFGRATL